MTTSSFLEFQDNPWVESLHELSTMQLSVKEDLADNVYSLFADEIILKP